MARPRKTILSEGIGKVIDVELMPIQANTADAQKRLSEAYGLVAHFIGLSRIATRQKQERENKKHAA